SPISKPNIFIGNLNSNTTPEGNASLFEPLGTVHKLKLITDRDTGLSRGFAFVEMMEVEAGHRYYCFGRPNPRWPDDHRAGRAAEAAPQPMTEAWSPAIFRASPGLSNSERTWLMSPS